MTEEQKIVVLVPVGLTGPTGPIGPEGTGVVVQTTQPLPTDFTNDFLWANNTTPVEPTP